MQVGGRSRGETGSIWSQGSLGSDSSVLVHSVAMHPGAGAGYSFSTEGACR